MTSPRPTRRLVTASVAAVLAVAALGACGDDDETTASTTTSGPSTTEAAAPEAALEISGAWARTSPAVATAGAVYLEITNSGTVDDALVGVAVDATVAAKAEIHETVAAGDGEGDMTSTTAMGEGTTMGDGSTTMPGSGMMEMRPVDEIAVPAGETVVLEPGGYHVMLLDLAAPLEVGSSIEVTLTFRESGDQVVTADVRDMAP